MFKKLKNMLGLGDILEERAMDVSGMTLKVQLRQLEDDQKQITWDLSTIGSKKVLIMANENVDGVIDALERLRGEEV